MLNVCLICRTIIYLTMFNQKINKMYKVINKNTGNCFVLTEKEKNTFFTPILGVDQKKHDDVYYNYHAVGKINNREDYEVIDLDAEEKNDLNKISLGILTFLFVIYASDIIMLWI